MRLGQHLLYDKSIIGKIVDTANINDNDIVFEIGSGNGILTRELCRRAKHVISCEIDNKLYNDLKLHYNNLELYNTDGYSLGLSINFDKFVSNIPYSRSRDTIELLAMKEFKLAVVMLQKEFTEKLSKDRAVSVIARYCFDIEHVSSIPRTVFKPRPSVDSLLIKLKKKHTLDAKSIRLVKLLYSFKGRKVKHASKLLSLKVDEHLMDKRVEMLKPEEVISIIDVQAI